MAFPSVTFSSTPTFLEIRAAMLEGYYPTAPTLSTLKDLIALEQKTGVYTKQSDFANVTHLYLGVGLGRQDSSLVDHIYGTLVYSASAVLSNPEHSLIRLVTVTSSEIWTITSNVAWMTITTEPLAENSRYISLTENTSTLSSRTGTLTYTWAHKTMQVSITQLAKLNPNLE